MRCRIAAELVDVLVAEDLATVLEARPGRLRARLADERVLTAGGRRDATRRWRTSPPVLLDGRPCHPAELVGSAPAAGEVRETLACAVEHAAWAESHRDAVVEHARMGGSRPGWEALASVRDRPGHPAAKARIGWSRDQLQRYAPEARATFWLHWAAVDRTAVRSGPVAEDPATWVCTTTERRQLEDGLCALGLDPATHLLLPVHPAHVHRVAEHQPLLPPIVEVAPTASTRTVLPVARPGVAVKLPLAIHTLAAERLLPPRYCANAVVGEDLLRRALARVATPVPVSLADERRWWVVDEGGDLTTDTGTLGCVVRLEPQADELVPLGALAEPAALAILCGSERVDDRLVLLQEVTAAVTGVALAAAAGGLAPELHGQNVLLRLDRGRVTGVVLRDHDAVRSYPPWRRAAGLPEPVLAVSSTSPNTLVSASPEELVAWFQTLAVDVALRGAAEALARGDPASECAAWRAIETGIHQARETVALPAPVATVLTRALEGPTWPLKQILRPWLARHGPAASNMPSAFGRQPNPLRAGHVVGAPA